MEQVISLTQIMAALKAYGPLGLVIIFLYLEIRANRKQAEVYRIDMHKVLKEHGDFMTEIRRMYENNVKLVENYEDVCGNLKDLIIMNTQGMQKVSDDINRNQFCPAARVDKKTVGVPA